MASIRSLAEELDVPALVLVDTLRKAGYTPAVTEELMAEEVTILTDRWPSRR